MTTITHISASERNHLTRAPYNITWWGGKPHSRPIERFNMGTHCRLIKRGWLRATRVDGFTTEYTLTAAGRVALTLMSEGGPIS